MATPKISLVKATVTEKRPEMEGLLRENWEEVARNKAVMVLEPDWPKYKTLEEAGFVFSIFAYEDHEMVGYSVNLIGPHLHYASLVTCQNDVVFVSSAHRGTAGLRLKSATEREAKALGAKLMLWHAKEGSVLDKLLDRQGYPIQDIIRSKEL